MSPSDSPAPPADTYSDRILNELLRLRAADALPLERVADAVGVRRYRFRSAGWPIIVDLDDTVLEVRAYYGNHTIATGHVPSGVMRVVVGDTPSGAGAGGGAVEAMTALRTVVAEWKNQNPRVHMAPPSVARHPDGWNNS